MFLISITKSIKKTLNKKAKSTAHARFCAGHEKSEQQYTQELNFWDADVSKMLRISKACTLTNAEKFVQRTEGRHCFMVEKKPQTWG